AKISALRKIGVPYPDGFEDIANDDLDKQAQKIVNNLKQQDNIDIAKEAEIVALIAYLQRLGTDIKVETLSSN
ncbi:MAG TPA: cbb3-type cytochrome c oxidase subunit II, partial [Cyclobacteriaceae bacterium]|nr:cbb3-type cytochrome c oxidase subunit II [Cyclobacteriaceae bacterium]